MKYLEKIILSFMLIFFYSCEEFLDKSPSPTSGITITTIEQVEGLFNRISNFNSAEDYQYTFYATDDYAFTTTMHKKRLLTNAFGLLAGLWDVDFYSTAVPTFRQFWKNPWKKVYLANLVLANLEKVPGSPEKKEELRKEARFFRAYSYMNLVNTYCLPYSEANKNELGLPLKRETNFEESLVRVSLEETYKFIEEDIKYALTLDRDIQVITNINNSAPNIWRANSTSVNAVAARFYLLKYEYNKALQYANKALNKNNSLVNYNSNLPTVTRDSKIYPTGSTSENFTLVIPAAFEDNRFSSILNWKGLYTAITKQTSTAQVFPSSELLGLYNTTYDLRYKYHYVEGYSYQLSSTARGNSSGLAAFPYPAYIFFGSSNRLRYPSTPSTPEMLLIKAECEARVGSWQNSITTLNNLRSTRFSSSAPANVINLTATDKNDAIKKVAEERRRELPIFFRWGDLRRYNNNETAIDDVTVTRSFYPYQGFTIESSSNAKPYTLSPKDRRYARPIPDSEISLSDGQLKQNIY